MKCQNCGTIIDSDSRFCEKCGTQIKQPEIIVKPESNSSNFKKYILAAFTLILIGTIGFMIFGICHHNWNEATCTSPRTCSKCEKTEGDPLGHSWVDATCTDAKHCSVCDEVIGEAKGHEWVNATCTTPKTCKLCNLVEGDVLSHTIVNWQRTVLPTCQNEGEEEGTCDLCGEKTTRSVEKTDHTFVWEEIRKPTCSEEGEEKGICSHCGLEETRTKKKKYHTAGKWTIIQEATDSEAGIRSRKCTICGEDMGESTYELTGAEKAAYYKKTCNTYSYDQVARNPDSYMLHKVKFQGTVIQVMEDDDEYTLRVRVGWNQVLYVWYAKEKGAPRILEDDYITLYGIFTGPMTYETVMGSSVTIPSMAAIYADY